MAYTTGPVEELAGPRMPDPDLRRLTARWSACPRCKRKELYTVILPCCAHFSDLKNASISPIFGAISTNSNSSLCGPYCNPLRMPN